VSARKPCDSAESAASLAADLRAAFRKLKLGLREHGGKSDLTPSQSSVILRLEKDGPCTVSGLARLEGMKPQSMSAIVTSLQEAGLVKGSADPSDGRQTLMGLTAKCEKLLREGRAARQDWLTARIAQTLTPQEQRKLNRALALLTRIVED
jgi:DNA-binding MarR family transcriptional regulator